MKTELMDLAELESMSKVEVRALADSLFGEEPEAIERCVGFVCAETLGDWHGRGRAMMCRRLKHIPLDQDQKDRLVARILERLTAGKFSEQFKDQLRLALHLNPGGTFAGARRALLAAEPHIQRYAEWVLLHEESGARP